MHKLKVSFIAFTIVLGAGLGFSAPRASLNPNAARDVRSETLVQSADDNALAAVRKIDRASRSSDGKLIRLPPAEHLRRANIYMSNRAFEEAREHWQALVGFYPQDPRVAEALLGIGRSHFQSRQYREAYAVYERLARTYPATKEGREALNFSGSALLRLGNPAAAVAKYIEYIERFPNGERIDTAHLNVIDTLREAGRNEEAVDWVGRTRQRFAGTSTETNALFALLRLFVSEGSWQRAVSTAEELTRRGFQRGVLTTPGEIAYLKAYSLDRAGDREGAINAYLLVSDSPGSFYGWLASQRLMVLTKGGKQQSLLRERVERVNTQIAAQEDSFPAPYRQTIVRAARTRKLDPRFILALIRQESVFRPLAKSPAGARGLLQLTMDAAQKYASHAGLNALRESELYRPETSILVGSEYLAHLTQLFPNMLEAVAASYNGGEDNVARWVKRAKHREPGVFTSEIGFDETKAYVQKVMTNYRAYCLLYTIDLARK
ncbi:MAG TPA: transglycosylase SLT domain-containing protein [Pyrinomonadaceae bacterium]|nr:transglycosylase SLT domain-containing protein [Pyrinomonadaceae bacterium]